MKPVTAARGSTLVLILLGAFLASVLLTVVAVRERGRNVARHELARLGLEDAARRVSESVRSRELVRKLSDKYDGIARNDRPDAVQTEFRSELIGAAMKLADVDAIARTIHVGRDGRVSITPLANGRRPSSKSRIETDAKGRTTRYFETVCEGYLVSVGIPESSSPLAKNEAVDILVVCDLVLLLLILIGLPTVRQTVAKGFQSLRLLFGASGAGGHDSFCRRWLTSPLMLIGLMVIVLLISVFWFVISIQAMRTANDTLLTAAKDIESDLSDCVDSLLYFQGDAICRHYGSPEKMTIDDLAEIMNRYGLDELNVVDGRGIVIRGALADVGYNMGSNPKSGEFNCLLDGKTKTYSQRFRAPIENPCGAKVKYAGVAFDPPARGYLQLGLSENRIKAGLDYFISGLADGWHIGDSGFFLIAKAATGEIVSSGRDFGPSPTLASIGFDVGVADSMPKESFEMVIGGELCLCRSGVVDRHHRYVAALPLGEVHGRSRRMVAATGFVLTVLLLLVVVFMTRLSDLVVSLKSYIAKDHEQREKDLAVAKTIQLSSLPVSLPSSDAYCFAARMRTAREVGGDFYDAYVLPSGKVFFLIADVSGKGIPAAMFMMRAKAIIRACAFEKTDFADIVAEANDRLAENNQAMMFVTVWFGLFDPKSGELEFVNAGHNPPLVKVADGSVRWITGEHEPVLAVMPTLRTPVVQRLTLAVGDRLFLYTDGVTEAMDASEELFGDPRLESCLAAESGDLIAGVISAVDKFVGDAEQSDDITMLTLTRNLA